MKHELLSKIKSPSDLKKLDEKQLPLLAEEVRDTIISTVSNNGGHLASNLGAVELTIALHKVFNSPDDKIIWDVGHQVYTHKLLTGRYEKFSTLRQAGGISGFSRPDESEHDIVFSGHSSVSVSTAMGIAAANKVFPFLRATNRNISRHCRFPFSSSIPYTQARKAFCQSSSFMFPGANGPFVWNP